MKSQLIEQELLSKIWSAYSGPIELDMLSCPECDSDELITWEDEMETNIKCEDCDYKTTVTWTSEDIKN